MGLTSRSQRPLRDRAGIRKRQRKTGGQVRSIEDAEEGEASVSKEALLNRRGFLKLCGGGLAALAGLMLLGAAGCGSGEDQQDGRQDADQQDDQQHTVRDVDRCPQRC